MTDDQTVADLEVMPRVRTLIADRGVTFSNYFISYSLCCPSRTTYLTGQYAHNHGVLANSPPLGGYGVFKHQDTTFPVALQRAGYRTIHIGKYLNRYGQRDPAEIPPGWSDWHASIDPSTYRYYGFTLNNNGSLYAYQPSEDEYQTDVYARLASDIVRQQAGSSHPFFLNVAFVAPHTGGGVAADHDSPADQAHLQMRSRHMDRTFRGSAVPPRRYAGHLRNEPLPRPPSFDETNVWDKPSFIRHLRLFTENDIHAIASRYRARLESLLAVDDAVQQITIALAETNQLDRTVILFTSDNGYLQGEHRIPYGKYLPYEESIRVPLLIKGPGFPRGATRTALTANIDLAPTILELAHARPLRRMDGRSLLPLVRHPHLHWRRHILLEAFTSHPSKTQQPYAGIRTPRYAYWEYGNGERELYVLQADPYELNNQASDPAFRWLEEELHGELTHLRRCAGASCSSTVPLTQPTRAD